MEIVKKRRAALQALIDGYGPRRLNWLAKQAKVAESALRAFLAGETQFLSERTYQRLAAYSGWTESQLKGDSPPPSDKESHKNSVSDTVVNDYPKGVGQNTYRTSDSPGSEGQMSHQLRLELVDKIWDLPADRLEGLKKHIDAIENALKDSARLPRHRGTAE